jgi:uncharacterized Zn ribbon protein
VGFVSENERFWKNTNGNVLQGGETVTMIEYLKVNGFGRM